MQKVGNSLNGLLTPGIARTVMFSLVLICGLFLTRAASAQSSDRVQFGDNIVLAAGQEAGDAVCFFCSVEIDGELQGDAVVFFGNLTVHGKVNDAVNFGGVTSVAEGGQISGDAVVIGGRLRAGSASMIQGDRVVLPPIIFLLPLLLLGSFIAALYYGLRWLFLRNRPVYAAPGQIPGRPWR